MTVEDDIKEVAALAEEFRQLLKMSMESTVEISIFDGLWFGKVFPSILIFNNEASALTHSYHAKTLTELITKMRDGTKEEITLFHEGKGHSLPGG